jgi:hypothetical protein
MEDICKLQSELTKCKVTFTSHESDLTLKNEVLNGQIETLTTELEESKCELAQINKQHVSSFLLATNFSISTFSLRAACFSD